MTGIDFRGLQDHFAADEIEWRVQQAGEKNGRIWAIAVPYVTNRAIQARLDEVVGPENWRNEFRPGPDGGVMCGLSIRVGDEWVTKWDGAENTDVEGVKGGLSGAMKRAAVQWGIGRYLYALDESFAQVHENGRFRGKLPGRAGGRAFRWDPPPLPAEVLPATRHPAELEALLEYVRSVAGQLPEGAEITIQRRRVPLRDYVREHWGTIREQPRIARAVVEAMESATGVPFVRAAPLQKRAA